MIVVGAILLALALAFGIDFVFANAYSVGASPEILGFALPIDRVAGVFALGAIVGAALLLGLGLILAGTGWRGAQAVKRRRARREPVEPVVAPSQQEVIDLRTENERLREEIALQRTPDTSGTSTRTVAGPDAR